LLQAGKTNILIDAGISARAITAKLEQLGVKAAGLAAVFITHEHQDHIQGLKVLLKKSGATVFTRPDTGNFMRRMDLIPEGRLQTIEKAVHIDDLQAECFPVSHDALDPVGYTFTRRGEKAVIMTDLGRLDDSLAQAAADADVIVMESNFDPRLLKEGPYPPFLKKRISGPRGHLSNTEAGEFLCAVPKKSHLKVFLAHLSRYNNTLPLAKYTVSQVLFENGADLYNQVSLFPTYPMKTVSLKF
jgi:phosphoribosyl 1,2-cyclic phosphodiesterase